MGGKAELRGLESVIANMNAISGNVRRHLGKAVGQARDVLYSAVKEKASLADHSLKDLADLGHPYSTRFATDSFVHPDEFVHTQSGRLVDNIEAISSIDGDIVTVACGVRESRVPYIGYLIDGTSKMRSRDFLGHAFQEKAELMLRIIKYGIVEGLGSRGGRR